MVENQTEGSSLEQKSVMRPLVTEKCKSCKIYWRMCDVYREESFSKKNFTNRLDMSFPIWAQVKKTVHWVETHWLSDKEKISRCSSQ